MNRSTSNAIAVKLLELQSEFVTLLPSVELVPARISLAITYFREAEPLRNQM
jgi:hypothetical protein